MYFARVFVPIVFAILAIAASLMQQNQLNRKYVRRQSGLEKRIAHGWNAKDNRLFFVKVSQEKLDGRRSNCGGSIISPWTVVTAAHCFNHTFTEFKDEVIVEHRDFTKQDGFFQLCFGKEKPRCVQRGTISGNVIIHRQFKVIEGENEMRLYGSDLAVITFHEKEEVFTNDKDKGLQFFQPLPICPKNYLPKSLRYVGMGTTTPLSADPRQWITYPQDRPTRLQERYLEELNPSDVKCKPTRRDPFPTDLKYQICFKRETMTEDPRSLRLGPTPGDSGGPIFAVDTEDVHKKYSTNAICLYGVVSSNFKAVKLTGPHQDWVVDKEKRVKIAPYN